MAEIPGFNWSDFMAGKYKSTRPKKGKDYFYDETRNQVSRLGQVGEFGQGAAETALGGLTPALERYQAGAEGLFNPEVQSRYQGVIDEALGGLTGLAGRVAGRAPGYTEEEKRAMKIGALAPQAAAFKQGQADVKARAARTGNAGAGDAYTSELARERARMASATGGGLEEGFANARLQDQSFKDQLLSGILTNLFGAGTEGQATTRENLAASQFPSLVRSNLFGTGVNAAIGAESSKSQPLASWANLASQPGFWGKLASGLTGKALGIAM